MRAFGPALIVLSAAAIAVAQVSIASPDAAESRERAAQGFVRAHHPELIAILKPLKAKDHAAYDAAIADLSRVHESIERMRRRDPDRANLALSVWKAGSRVDLLTARLISAPSPRLESELEQALARQVEAQLALQRHDRDRARQRLSQLQQSIDRLERRGDALAASRLQAALRNVRRARRQAGKPEAPSTPETAPPNPPDAGESPR